MKVLNQEHNTVSRMTYKGYDVRSFYFAISEKKSIF